MSDVRFTSSLIDEIAGDVEAFTGGAFGLGGIGGDLGYGTRYIDLITTQVWLGPNGARECAAYLIGAALEWARQSGTEIPADKAPLMQDVQRAYSPREKFRSWEERGRQDAQYRYKR